MYTHASPRRPWLSRHVVLVAFFPQRRSARERFELRVEGRLTFPLTDSFVSPAVGVQGLAGLLALMCLVGTVMGFYASWKRSTLFMSLVRTAHVGTNHQSPSKNSIRAF